MLKTVLKKIIPKYSSLYFVGLGIYKEWGNITQQTSFKSAFKDFKALSKSSRNPSRFEVTWENRRPFLYDNTTETPFDHHYVYHPAWAARILAKINPKEHIDISSTLHFSTIVSAFVPTKFYDYRPAQLDLEGLTSERGDLNNLPFESNTILSISCMHTIEHIGLGRYGDRLDYDGDIKAINELQRVTKEGGDILFVTPVGKPVLVFNAHRIYGYKQIIDAFDNCQLEEFTLITDDAKIITNASEELSNQQQYGCGCFWFKKRIF